MPTSRRKKIEKPETSPHILLSSVVTFGLFENIPKQEVKGGMKQKFLFIHKEHFNNIFMVLDISFQHKMTFTLTMRINAQSKFSLLQHSQQARNLFIAPTGQKKQVILLFIKKSLMCSFVANSLQPHGLQPSWFLCPLDFTGKNT